MINIVWKKFKAISPITIFTAVLAVSTIGLWCSTKKQVDLSYKIFEQANRPYVFIDKLQFTTDENLKIITFSLPIKNVGSIPAATKLEKACYISETGGEDCIPPLNESYYVYPNSDKSIIAARFSFHGLDPDERKIIVFKLSYSSMADKEKNFPYHYEEFIILSKAKDQDYKTVTDKIYAN